MHYGKKTNVQKTKDAQFIQLDTAYQILKVLHNNQIGGQDRDFEEFCDVNKAAIQFFDSEYVFKFHNNGRYTADA